MLALCLTLAATAVGQAVLFVVVPVIGETTKIGLGSLSLVVAAGIVVFVISAPLWGRASDRLGRREIMLWGCSGVILGQGGFAVTIALAAQGYIATEVTLGMMVFSRMIHGASAAALFPIAQAWVADVYGESERLSKFGTLRLAMTLGRLAGPPLAAALTLLAPLAPIYILVVFAVIALLAMGACQEPSHQKQNEAESADVPPRRRSPFLSFPLLLSVVVLLATMNGQLQFAIGLHAQTRLHLSAVQASQFVGIMLTMAAIAALVIQMFVIRRLNGRSFAALTLSGVMASCAVALVYWGGHWGVFALAAVFVGASLAMAFPACAALLAAAQDRRHLGSAMGAFGSAQTIGYALGAALGGLYDVAPAVSFGISFCAPLVAIVLVSVCPDYRSPAVKALET